MSAFAEILTPQERRRARVSAYFACYFGCVSEVMMDSSAIIILYIGMLGGGNMLVMLSTGFSGIASMFLMIPSALLIGRIGLKRAAVIACLAGCAGYLLMAAAPWFGALRKVAAVAGCLIYCVQRSLYGAAWYPMLDVFLRAQDRGAFFGVMRCTYMIFSGALCFLLGKLMGQHPPLRLMQLSIGVTGLMILGRLYCMLRFPDNPMEKTVKLDLRRALGISLRNGPLASYAVYICLLSIAYTSLVPLTLVYLKEAVGLAAGPVQVFSTTGIAGSIAGFFFYGGLLKKLRLRRLELLVHLVFLLAPAVLFLLPKEQPGFLWICGGVYFLTSFAISTFLCNNSLEIIALARPGNKPMAMALQQTYQNVGISIGRAGTAVILGANLLAPSWNLGSLTISSYQTLFLLYGTIAAVILVLLPTLPSVVPKRHDYYDPAR